MRWYGEGRKWPCHIRYGTAPGKYGPISGENRDHDIPQNNPGTSSYTHPFPLPSPSHSPLTPLTNRLTPLTGNYSTNTQSPACHIGQKFMRFSRNRVVAFSHPLNVTELFQSRDTTSRVSSLTIKLLAHPLASPLPHSGRLVMSLAYGEPPYKLFICIFRKKISCNSNSPRIN